MSDWQDARKMTPRMFKTALKQLELTQAGAARFVGVSERTARRFASGETKVPASVALLLQVCVALSIEPRVPGWHRNQN